MLVLSSPALALISSCVALGQTFAGCRVWGLGFTVAIYSAASSKVVNGSRPVSGRPPGCYYVSCHCRGLQVISTALIVHVLLCLDVDDRILWYNTIKVCIGRLHDPSSWWWMCMWSWLCVYVCAHKCVQCHLICPIGCVHFKFLINARKNYLIQFNL